MPGEVANVICIKWGDKYHARDVNRLFAMLARNVHRHELRFICFTDDASGLLPEIEARPLPDIGVDDMDGIPPIYRKEVALCDDDLGGLRGQRVFFFDLDVVIIGGVDEMLEYPSADQFVIINDWNTRGDHVGQASCYSWVVGMLGFIREDFISRPREVVREFHTASQAYISHMVREKRGALHFWPERWCCSFKRHILPVWWKRAFIRTVIPDDAKLLVFHGDPKIEDAIAGRWSKKPVPIWKRLYKTIRPSPWIADYWHD